MTYEQEREFERECLRRGIYGEDKYKIRRELERKLNGSGDFLTSAVIGAATGSALLGGILGGDLLGGVVGDLFDGDLFD